MDSPNRQADKKVTFLSLSEGQYEGYTRESQLHGLGVFMWSNGDAYFGEWFDGKMHGEGLFLYSSGEYVDGNFIMNYVGGLACLNFPDGSYIKGIYNRGKLNGRALYYDCSQNRWQIQDYKDGNMEEIFLEGEGPPLNCDFWTSVLENSGKSRRFSDNFLIQSNSSGPEKDDLDNMGSSQSLGALELGNGKYYGVSNNGKPEGLGIVVQTEKIEVGTFLDGQLNGKGRRLELGKSYYKGNFKNGKYDGKGVLYDADRNQKLIGNFQNGQIVELMNEDQVDIDDLNDETNCYNTSNPLDCSLLPIRDFHNSLFLESPNEKLNSPAFKKIRDRSSDNSARRSHSDKSPTNTDRPRSTEPFKQDTLENPKQKPRQSSQPRSARSREVGGELQLGYPEEENAHKAGAPRKSQSPGGASTSRKADDTTPKSNNEGNSDQQKSARSKEGSASTPMSKDGDDGIPTFIPRSKYLSNIQSPSSRAGSPQHNNDSMRSPKDHGFTPRSQYLNSLQSPKNEQSSGLGSPSSQQQQQPNTGREKTYEQGNPLYVRPGDETAKSQMGNSPFSKGQDPQVSYNSAAPGNQTPNSKVSSPFNKTVAADPNTPGGKTPSNQATPMNKPYIQNQQYYGPGQGMSPFGNQSDPSSIVEFNAPRDTSEIGNESPYSRMENSRKSPSPLGKNGNGNGNGGGTKPLLMNKVNSSNNPYEIGFSPINESLSQKSHPQSQGNTPLGSARYQQPIPGQSNDPDFQISTTVIKPNVAAAQKKKPQSATTGTKPKTGGATKKSTKKGSKKKPAGQNQGPSDSQPQTDQPKKPIKYLSETRPKTPTEPNYKNQLTLKATPAQGRSMTPNPMTAAPNNNRRGTTPTPSTLKSPTNTRPATSMMKNGTQSANSLRSPQRSGLTSPNQSSANIRSPQGDQFLKKPQGSGSKYLNAAITSPQTNQQQQQQPKSQHQKSKSVAFQGKQQPENDDYYKRQHFNSPAIFSPEAQISGNPDPKYPSTGVPESGFPAENYNSNGSNVAPYGKRNISPFNPNAGINYDDFYSGSAQKKKPIKNSEKYSPGQVKKAMDMHQKHLQKQAHDNKSKSPTPGTRFDSLNKPKKSAPKIENPPETRIIYIPTKDKPQPVAVPTDRRNSQPSRYSVAKSHNNSVRADSLSPYHIEESAKSSPRRDGGLSSARQELLHNQSFFAPASHRSNTNSPQPYVTKKELMENIDKYPQFKYMVERYKHLPCDPKLNPFYYDSLSPEKRLNDYRNSMRPARSSRTPDTYRQSIEKFNASAEKHNAPNSPSPIDLKPVEQAKEEEKKDSGKKKTIEKTTSTTKVEEKPTKRTIAGLRNRKGTADVKINKRYDNVMKKDMETIEPVEPVTDDDNDGNKTARSRSTTKSKNSSRNLNKTPTNNKNMTSPRSPDTIPQSAKSNASKASSKKEQTSSRQPSPTTAATSKKTSAKNSKNVSRARTPNESQVMLEEEHSPDTKERIKRAEEFVKKKSAENTEVGKASRKVSKEEINELFRKTSNQGSRKNSDSNGGSSGPGSKTKLPEETQEPISKMSFARAGSSKGDLTTTPKSGRKGVKRGVTFEYDDKNFVVPEENEGSVHSSPEKKIDIEGKTIPQFSQRHTMRDRYSKFRK